MNRRDNEASARFAERRRREDDARRLHDEAPGLATLKMAVEERRNGSLQPEVSHTRHVMVASAPALFELPCADKECEGGGHDLTQEILRQLRARVAHFEGEDSCSGQLRGNRCGRVLRFTCEASYGE